MPGSLVFEATDCWERKVVFTQKKLREKVGDHPELNKAVFLNNVQRTVEEPEQIWENKENPKCKQVYYRKYSRTDYIKVVVWVKDSPCQVVTAYLINHVKEEKYPGIKRLL